MLAAPPTTIRTTAGVRFAPPIAAPSAQASPRAMNTTTKVTGIRRLSGGGAPGGVRGQTLGLVGAGELGALRRRVLRDLPSLVLQQGTLAVA